MFSEESKKGLPQNPKVEESFEQLFRQTTPEAKRLVPGQMTQATVVGFSEQYVFLDVGDKSEGVIAKTELVDEQGNLTVGPGDTLRVYLLSATGSGKLFTTKVGASTASMDHLEAAFQKDIPIEGLIEKEIKGGFEVKIAGNIRAFCPISQISLRHVQEPDAFIGQKHSFKIIEFRENGRNIIVSRRALLEEERRRQKEDLVATLKTGMTVKGKVTSIREFGAFVDIGGVDGLIPISEIGWGQVEDINEFLSVGEDIEVVVLSLDWERDRIALSLKQTLADPWEENAAKFTEGSYHSGTVSRLTKFGAFVNLAPGIDGLLHISKLGAGRRINHPREAVEEGQTLEVRIEGVDREKKRISLDLATSPQEDRKHREQNEYEYYLEKKKRKSEAKSLGAFGDLLQAKLREKEKK